MESLVARVGSLALKLWLRLVSPTGMRLVAPLLAVALFVVVGSWYRRAGLTALGRAVRWWLVAGVLALVCAATLYLLAGGPEDPETIAALRSADSDLIGRAPLPRPIAAVGGALVGAASLAAAWRWRQAQQLPGERAALAARWQAVRGRWLAAGAIVVGLPSAALVTACAAAAVGPAQVPNALTGNPAGGPGAAGGSLWVGTPLGASRLRPGARWEAFAPPHAPLPASRVSSIAAGPQGEVWLATNGGLVRYQEGGTPEWQRATVENAGLPYPSVLGVAVDRRGVAWASTGAGGAGVAPDGRGRGFTNANAPLLHQILDAVLVDSEGRVWFGGAGGVNAYQPGPDPLAQGDWPVGFTRYSSNGALPDDLVFTITQDRRGRIWFGTNAGAAAFTPQQGAFALGAFDAARWQTFTAATSPLVQDKVHAIAEDRQGRIWLGTEQGISILEEGAGGPRWQQLAAGATGGLPHPWVQALLVAPDGRVWAGTHGGLAVYDPANPGQGWTAYHANALRRWTGIVWPAHWQQNILSDDVIALAWVP